MRVAIVSLVLLAASSVRAGEEKIAIKELPANVLAAVRIKFPEGKLIRAAKEEEGRDVSYEVSLTDRDAKVDVAVSAKGTILEVEKTTDPKTLPDAVATTIKAKYPMAKVTKAEEVIKYEGDEEETFFEVILATPDKKESELKLSPKGKVLDDEEDEDEDGDKD